MTIMENNQKPETPIQDNDIVFDETLQSYYDNGKIHMRAHYLNGKVTGLCQMWREDGVKFTECTFKDGVHDGVSRWWYANGQLRESSNYKKGKLEVFTKRGII